jgi:hypothetical protein
MIMLTAPGGNPASWKVCATNWCVHRHNSEAVSMTAQPARKRVGDPTDTEHDRTVPWRNEQHRSDGLFEDEVRVAKVRGLDLARYGGGDGGGDFAAEGRGLH